MRARLCSGLLCLLLASGCSVLPSRATPALAAGVALQQVPFFPQSDYQCGPAALAMLLSSAGIAVTPEALVPQVYLPARHGSLQAELLAAARRHDRLPYVIDPTAAALQAQLKAGHPVLVLQNFGSRRSPLWHYAVVIGYEPGARAYLLRSGITARQRLVARRFLATWERADHWAVVLAAPGQVPIGAQPARYLQAVSALESAGHYPAAALGYAAAVAQWPDAPLAWFGLAGARLAQGQPAAAETAYEQLLQRAPAHVAARNNLAVLLARRGCIDAARSQLSRARSDDRGTHAATLADTAVELDRLAATARGLPENCPAP